jgi:hypothetical protein
MIGKLAVLVCLAVLGASSAGMALAATGGPDAGGYTFINNVGEANPPPFAFVPLAAGDIGSNCDDCVLSGVNIGFSFTFYGSTFTTMNISSNGNIQFEGADSEFANSSLPSTSIPNNGNGGISGRVITPWWDDLQTDCNTNDAILVQTTGTAPNRQTIVQWRMAPHFFCSSGDITFQVVLFETTNHILFRYADTAFESGNPANDGASATVGIQRDSTTALQYSFNSPVITQNLAICFRPSASVSVAPCGAPAESPLALFRATPTPRPQIGAALGAVNQASGTQRNLAAAGLLPQAPQAAPVQSAPVAAAGAALVVRPPSTGDGGLRHDARGEKWTVLALALALGGSFCLAPLLRRRSRLLR